MAIPRAVEAAEKRAEELYAQMYNQDLNPQDPPAPNDPAPDPDPTPQDNQVDPAAQDPQDPPPQDPPKEDPWEHKYKVMEGKYRAEVPRLAADNRDLRQKLDNLSAEMEQLKSKASTPSQPLISAEDREKYGDDLLDVIKRTAQEQVAAKDQEIAELKRRLDSVHQDTAKTAEVTFYDQLSAKVPDWVSINGEESFLKWLDEYDELTGRTRQDLLSEAEGARDAERVARFFTKWKATQQQNVATSQRNLQAQVTPDSNKVVKPPVGKRYFTRAEIAEFYAAARRGQINSKDMIAMEAEIHSATVEGRIR
jgi:cell division septum initiation protein DivIVA